MSSKPTWLQVFWWQLRTAYHCCRILGLSWVLAWDTAAAHVEAGMHLDLTPSEAAEEADAWRQSI